MIPAGYLYKEIVGAPDWVGAPAGTVVYSLSNCISDDFTDYIPYWRHNGFWLFDSVETLESVADRANLDTSGLSLLYYEVFEEEYDENGHCWVSVAPDPDIRTSVRPPPAKHLLGFDVVTFSCRNTPECSPLSCNALAREIRVNRYCLLDSLQTAREALDSGRFDGSEPGPFRIFAVYSLAPMHGATNPAD